MMMPRENDDTEGELSKNGCVCLNVCDETAAAERASSSLTALHLDRSHQTTQ